MRRLILDFLQAVPDDVEQAGGTREGEAGWRAALEHQPDALDRVEILADSGSSVSAFAVDRELP
jgi:hypothetical protein